MDQRRTERARDLRRTSTKPEQVIWELLRPHRLEGVKFRRQHPIGPYFADFACPAKKLAIEIDGEHHALQVEADEQRTKAMEQLGWRVVRFTARYVLESPEGIWMEIERLLRSGP